LKLVAPRADLAIVAEHENPSTRHALGLDREVPHQRRSQRHETEIATARRLAQFTRTLSQSLDRAAATLRVRRLAVRRVGDQYVDGAIVDRLQPFDAIADVNHRRHRCSRPCAGTSPHPLQRRASALRFPAALAPSLDHRCRRVAASPPRRPASCLVMLRPLLPAGVPKRLRVPPRPSPLLHSRPAHAPPLERGA
jgi:hypothetical protein